MNHHRHHPTCECGRAAYQSRANAVKGLDRARQLCRRAGQPEPTWPSGIFRCPTRPSRWHLMVDSGARDAHLRRDWRRFEQLLAASRVPTIRAA